MRTSSLVSGAGLAAATLQLAPAPACHLPVLADRLGLQRRLADRGGVALTFDDGPHRVATPRVLTELEAHGARATFFLVGEQVRRHPRLAAEIAAAGHTIGLHGDTHRCELRLPAGALEDDWARGIDAIHGAAGVSPVLRRPPYGAASGLGLVLAGRAGLRTVLWNRWGRDWRARATPASVAAQALGPAPTGGEIVLLHDSDRYGAPGCWRATVSALPRMLEAIGSAGLRTVAL